MRNTLNGGQGVMTLFSPMIVTNLDYPSMTVNYEASTYCIASAINEKNGGVGEDMRPINV